MKEANSWEKKPYIFNIFKMNMGIIFFQKHNCNATLSYSHKVCNLLYIMVCSEELVTLFDHLRISEIGCLEV